jgi:hypothetical protein
MLLLGLGAFFVVFYVAAEVHRPGRIAVLIVWGPLMIGTSW